MSILYAEGPQHRLQCLKEIRQSKLHIFFDDELNL
jgi:hypothetical protein